MHFEMYRDKAKKYRWRLLAENNRVISSGEGYHLRADCMKAIHLVQSTNDGTPINVLPVNMMKKPKA